MAVAIGCYRWRGEHWADFVRCSDFAVAASSDCLVDWDCLRAGDVENIVRYMDFVAAASSDCLVDWDCSFLGIRLRNFVGIAVERMGFAYTVDTIFH